jgi:hypothetical protein
LIAQSTGVTKQYEMLGNLVTPEIARRIGMGIRTHLNRDKEFDEAQAQGAAPF